MKGVGSWIWTTTMGLVVFALVLNFVVGVIVATLTALLPLVLVVLIAWLLVRFGLSQRSRWIDEWFGRW